MKPFMLLYISSNSIQCECMDFIRVEYAFANAVTMIANGVAFAWQIQEMTGPVNSPDNVLEYRAVPIAESPNWKDFQ